MSRSKIPGRASTCAGPPAAASAAPPLPPTPARAPPGAAGRSDGLLDLELELLLVGLVVRLRLGGRPTASCSSASSTSGVACSSGFGAPFSSGSSAGDGSCVTVGTPGRTPGTPERSPDSPCRELAACGGRRGRRSLARLRFRATDRSGQLSAFRGAACGGGTTCSTCAAEAAPGCSACSCWSGSCGACTPHKRGWQRCERLHEPCTRFRLRGQGSGHRTAGAETNAARRRPSV